jgi:hypothetical protein
MGDTSVFSPLAVAVSAVQVMVISTPEIVPSSTWLVVETDSVSVRVVAGTSTWPKLVPAVVQSAFPNVFDGALDEHVNVVVPSAAEALAAANALKQSAHSTVSPMIDLRAVISLASPFSSIQPGVWRERGGQDAGPVDPEHASSGTTTSSVREVE